MPMIIKIPICFMCDAETSCTHQRLTRIINAIVYFKSYRNIKVNKLN